jgi:hypothetical protein
MRASHAENQRVVLGRAFLESCLGKGPGFTLDISKNESTYEYIYTILGVGHNGGRDSHVPEQLIAMSEAFRSISPDGETRLHCETLTKGAASISAKAMVLSLMAKRLAKHTVLAGDCEYTKLD